MATPADLAGKTLWLDAEDLAGADGSTVTSWLDRSGLGHDATAVNGTVIYGATPNGSKAFRSSNVLRFPNLHPLLGIQASASSAVNASYKASDLVDGLSSATYDSQYGWASAVAPTVAAPQWAQLQPPTPTVVTRYRIYGQGGGGSTQYNRYPKDFTFQGAMDPAGPWTTLDSRSGVVWTTRGQSQLFTFANTNPYAYYRLNITATQGGADIVHLGEIELNETPNGNPRSPGEIWLVVRSNGLSSGSAASWALGNASGGNYYPSTDGKIYDAGISNTRRSFTPTMPIIGEWRLLRIRHDAAGVNTWWLDETQQFTVSGATIAWKQDPALVNGSAVIDFAGALIRTTVATPAEIADLITWFNTKYGLSVPGGSTSSNPVTITLPSLTASAAGNTLITGAAAATLPSLTADVTGDVHGPESATVDATLPALTAAVEGDIIEPVTGSLAAGLPRLRAAIVDGGILDLTLSAGSTLDISDVTVPVIVSETLDLDAASTLDIDGGSVLPVVPQDAGMILDAGSMLRITIPRDWGENPRTGRPDYRVKIVTRDGTGVVELDKATLAPETEAVNAPDTFSFRVARSDAKARRVLAVAHQAQLWRGKVMLTKGDIGPGRADGAWITFDVKDPSALLFDKRVIGRIPKRQLLRNADFTKGLAYWTGAYGKDSALKEPPTARVVDEFYAISGKALELGAVDKVVTTKVDVQTSAVFVPNQATYLSGGEQKIKDVGKDIPDGAVVRITGYTANDGTGDGLNLSLRRAQAAKATLAAMGKKLVFKMPSPLRTPNANDGTVVGRGYYEQIPGGLAPNRRVTIAYEGTQTATGHQQYERQTLTVSQPVDAKVPLTITLAGDMRIIRWDGAPKDGWAMRLVLRPLNNFDDAKLIDEGTATMDEATPRVRWAHYETSVEVPADGKTYTLEVQFQPPAGLALWANLGLWPHDQLGYFDVDQALIVKALVQHAQDPAMGKASLGIGTRTPLTGVPRTKEYPFHERMPVGTALEWFTSIAHGVDIDCETTPDAATIVTHYPRQGTPADLALVHGGSKSNVKAYRPLTTGGRDLASSIIMQADGSGAARAEAYARDGKALGGTLLESVISAESETPPGELQEGADVALAQSLNPRPGWEVVVDPAQTTRVLDEVGKGDIVRLSLPDEDVDRTHRLISRTLDPATDTLTLTLVEA